MQIITIDSTNIDDEHICCAIGNDKTNQQRARSKKDWLKDRFSDGLTFKRFDQRGKIFIEYIPMERCWKPLEGRNYMVINCLWVSGQFKGKGLSTQLLAECIHDAKSRNMDGIAVVSSSKVKPFLTDKKFYQKQGFEVVDSAPPYFELLVLKFNKNAESPRFTRNAKKGTCSDKAGFTFIFSSQCPFMGEYVVLLSEICRGRNIPFEVKKLRNYEEAQQLGSPFGTLGIYYHGKFLTHELMPQKKFEKFIDEIIGC
jgi:ribosomal protein S18 acetylase RimI-like enzyme